MGERTSHPPGTFSWVDLATTDAAGAKRFYGELFGWEFEDDPVGEGIVYTMCLIDGKSVCAISGQREEERSQVPPHWNNYVTVEAVDASTGKAKELDGNVMMEPFDVFDAGRMSVIAEPTGAVLCMWEPRNNIGAELVNVPGALTWNELATKDVERAKEFYGALFGWGFEAIDGGGGMPYTVIHNGDRSNGGIREQSEMEAGIPPNWVPYFAAETVDDTVAKAGELGGRVLVQPMTVPAGRFAAIADPQGAVFAVFEGEFDD